MEGIRNLASDFFGGVEQGQRIRRNYDDDVETRKKRERVDSVRGILSESVDPATGELDEQLAIRNLNKGGFVEEGRAIEDSERKRKSENTTMSANELKLYEEQYTVAGKLARGALETVTGKTDAEKAQIRDALQKTLDERGIPFKIEADKPLEEELKELETGALGAVKDIQQKRQFLTLPEGEAGEVTNYEVIDPTEENPRGLKELSRGERGSAPSPTAGVNADLAATREIRIQTNGLFAKMFDAQGNFIGVDNTVPVRIQKIQEKAKELHAGGKVSIASAVAAAFEQVEGVPMQAFIDASQRFNADPKAKGLSLGAYNRQAGAWQVVNASGKVVGAFK
jgi:hypothetical protein